jgi:hypothetical protein
MSFADPKKVEVRMAGGRCDADTRPAPDPNAWIPSLRFYEDVMLVQRKYLNGLSTLNHENRGQDSRHLSRAPATQT